MSNIQKWTVPCYSRGQNGDGTAISSLGTATLYIDFDRKQFQIELADETTITGTIQTYLSGAAYQASDMFGFSTKNATYMFGDNNRFYPGYLLWSTTGDGSLVWSSKQTSTYGPAISASKTGFTSTTLPAGETVAAICYLPGTALMTPGGERLIETLKPGDRVITLRNGVEQSETIIWTGKARHNVGSDRLDDDRAGYPICFRKDALGEGKPNQDLYVTAEHCLYLAGCFVLARMLVNDMTIFYDRTITDYEYHHIELERHAIILANGVESESYLDTGNRMIFEQSALTGSTIHHLPQNCSWQHDACAPLNVTTDFVRELWERFSPIALENLYAEEEFTSEPDLHLVSQSGGRLDPFRQTGNTYLFRLDGPLATYKITSRRARPCDETGPFLDDRRYFGVLICDMTLWASDRTLSLDLKETSHICSGWHRGDQNEGCWTTGSASVCLSPGMEEGDGPRVLSVTITRTRRYPLGVGGLPALPTLCASTSRTNTALR